MDDEQFQVTLWGVRGSVPTPTTSQQVAEKINKVLELVRPEDLESPESRKAFVDRLPVELGGCVGGNSACVQVDVGGNHIIFDGGSGIRELGLDWGQNEFGQGKGRAHIFLSHTHCDHIMGLPFFAPFYVKGNHVTIYSPLEDVEKRIVGQQKPEYFPIPFDHLAATVDFSVLNNQQEMKIGDARVTWKEMYHPGRSFSYRIEYKGKSMVYSTDSEYKKLDPKELFPGIDFFRGADLLIFDAQYTFSEGLQKEDWGHSSTFIGVDMAVEAGVKQIAFYHHEPNYSDFELMDILRQTEKYLRLVGPHSDLKMVLAHEGLSVDLLNPNP